MEPFIMFPRTCKEHSQSIVIIVPLLGTGLLYPLQFAEVYLILISFKMKGNFRKLLRKFCLEGTILGLKYFYLYSDRFSRYVLIVLF